MAKKNKSLPRYIFSIKSLYYFRYILPPDIAEVVKKRELRYALQTGYIRKAKIKANRLIASVNEFVQNVRQEPHKIMNLSEAQVQTLLDQHLRQSLNDDEERRVSANRIDPDDLDDELETISFIKSDLKEELAVNDYEGISSHVDDLLKELNVKPDKKSENYKKLCRELLKVNIKILDTVEKRTVGDYSRDANRTLDDFQSSTASKPTQTK